MTTLTHFVQNYNGPKIAILATGGGMNLARIATIPGASRVLHSFYCPYETEETLRFLRENHPTPAAFQASAVSAGAARELYEAMANKYRNQAVLVITAACTSSRWRRGENRAFIACKNSEGVVEVWHLKIPKATEAEYRSYTPEIIAQVRDLEDQGISNTALALLANITHVLEGLKTDGALTLCNP
jgi:nicotinamide mononucleotide (NMN) deamidase PncC